MASAAVTAARRTVATLEDRAIALIVEAAELGDAGLTTDALEARAGALATLAAVDLAVTRLVDVEVAELLELVAITS